MTVAEKVAQLEAIVGIARFTSPRLGFDDWKVAKNAAPLTQSGDRNVYDRMREIGVSQDTIVENEVPALKAQIAALSARLAALESATPTAPASTIGLPLVPAAGTAVREMRDLNAAKAGGHIVPFSAAALSLPVDQVHPGNHAFPGKVAVGTDKVLDLDADLQVSGGGEVVFHTRVAAGNTQEKNGDRTRLGVVSFSPYDNGVRFIRGAAWRNGVMHHNPDDPTVHVLGMDSQGTVSKSTEEYSSGTTERSQLWIVREDHENKEIVFVPCRAGWGFRIAASTRTTNMNNEQNFNRTAQIIGPLQGAV